MKKIKPYLVVALLILIAIILLSNKLIIWGIGVLAASLIRNCTYQIKLNKAF